MAESIEGSALNVHSMDTKSGSENTTENEDNLINSLKPEIRNVNTNSDILETPSKIDDINTLHETKNAEDVLPENLTDSDDEMYKQITEDGWEDILGSGRLKKRILKEGKRGLATEGLGRPSRNDNVTVSMKGYFEDTLFEEIKELQFVTAEAEVVQAIDLCVVLMNTGEVAEVMADPEMAYGSMGLLPHVPPKAAVRFEIELLSHSAAISPSEIPIEERSSIGRRKKDRGNFWFSRQNYTEAVQCYRKAAEFFDDEKLELEVPIDRYQLPQELQDLLEHRLKAYNNLAMAQMKIEAWDSAMAAIQQVLKIEPNNEKALYRKSKVLLEKYRTEEALGILRRISRLYPNNSSAKADLVRVSAKQKKSRENEEKISKKMLGLDKYEAEKSKEKWYTKYVRNGIFSTKNTIIGVSAVIFAAAGTAAYFAQFHL